MAGGRWMASVLCRWEQGDDGRGKGMLSVSTTLKGSPCVAMREASARVANAWLGRW